MGGDGADRHAEAGDRHDPRLVRASRSSRPETKAFLNKFGGDPLIETPEQAQARFLKDIKEWEAFVQTAKIEKQ